MTGFGRGEASAGPFRATVEIRSVNHRFADIKIKLPAELASVEAALHRRLQQSVHRGRIEVGVNVAREGDDETAFEVNGALVAAYLKAAEQLRSEYRLEGRVTLDTILSLPDSIRSRAPEGGADRAEQDALMAAFEAALASHDAMRVREGEILARDLKARTGAIEKLRSRIASRAPRMVPLYARRLKARVKELDGGSGSRVPLEPGRLAQEVALAAERSDITEELVRLAGYLEQLEGLLDRAREPVGKKLDFIMQEMNRESNTITSKAIDLAICKHAIEIKAEVEKIREQVQNIE